MASGAGPALAHRSVASIRTAPQLASPSSPHTPQRPIASNYGSPSAIRADDDIVIIQLGSRLVRAGFAGDSVPKAVLSSGPDDQRRVGDYRAWQGAGETACAGNAWAAEHEIWRYDLRELDLGLFQDKLDRLLREAFTKYVAHTLISAVAYPNIDIFSSTHGQGGRILFLTRQFLSRCSLRSLTPSSTGFKRPWSLSCHPPLPRPSQQESGLHSLSTWGGQKPS